jgi:hypothetical protein
MAIEVEGKIFSTGNNPSLQRLMDLAMFEGRTTATTTRKPHLLFKQKKECLWFNRLELLSLQHSYPIEPCFLASFPPLSLLCTSYYYYIFLDSKNLKQTGMGRRIYQSHRLFFWSKFFDGSSSLITKKKKTGTLIMCYALRRRKKPFYLI